VDSCCISGVASIPSEETLPRSDAHWLVHAATNLRYGVGSFNRCGKCSACWYKFSAARPWVSRGLHQPWGSLEVKKGDHGSPAAQQRAIDKNGVGRSIAAPTTPRSKFIRRRIALYVRCKLPGPSRKRPSIRRAGVCALRDA